MTTTAGAYRSHGLRGTMSLYAGAPYRDVPNVKNLTDE